MSGQPRRDGVWEFYEIESLYKREADRDWGVYSFYERYDTRERIEALGLDYEEVTLKPSGNVWQQSSIHGTPSLEYARVLLRLCNKHHPEHAHRIVKRRVTRQTEVIEYRDPH
jgi:hypothetical protein